MTRDVVKTPQSLKEIEKFIADSTVDYENATNVNDLRLQAYRTQGCCVFTQLRLDMRFLRFFALCIWRFEKFKRKVNLHQHLLRFYS